MRPEEALLAPEGVTVPLLGNEALARGLLEGGLRLATAYPGTPSTEMMTTLMRINQGWINDDGAGNPKRLHTEWSVNEKVATEAAIAGSMSGLRSVTAMKGVGLNVASEPLQAYTYMGLRGGLVIIVADDPGMHSSHTEQDNRLLARQAHLPVLEPTTPQEAREMTAAAFDLSEAWGQPVIIKTTTRISHTRADVTLGALPPWPVGKKAEVDDNGAEVGDEVENEVETGVEDENGDKVGDGTTAEAAEPRDAQMGFQTDPTRWVNLPVNARRMRLELIERLRVAEEAASQLVFNRYEGPAGARKVVIASGAAYGPVKEALLDLNLSDEVGVMKVATPYPLPARSIIEALAKAESVLVVEELEPLVEQSVITLVHKAGLKARVTGKELVPLAGELNVVQVLEALRTFTGAESPRADRDPVDLDQTGLSELTRMVRPRPPTLCAGCGHRTVFYAMAVIERRLKRQGLGGLIKPSDIGCYTLGYNPPLNGVDAHLCMGGSIGMATGFAAVNEVLTGTSRTPESPSTQASGGGARPIVCTIGDGTFFHAGLPPLTHAASTGADLTVIILDNDTTAMTGHQPHPGAPVSGKAIAIPEVVRALGIEWVRSVDALDLRATLKTLEEAIAHPGPAVIIADSPCAILTMRGHLISGGPPAPYIIDQERCTNCGICIDRFACPAIQRPELTEAQRVSLKFDDTDKAQRKALPKPVILHLLCSACGVCSQKLVCAIGAIHPPADVPVGQSGEVQ